MAGSSDHETTYRQFKDTVNMTANELEKWLDTDESNEVGQKSGNSESTGHASGRRIVKLLQTKKSDLGDDDYAHMRTVVGYAHRHLAQRPNGDVSDSAWRYSLMNWGHDPCK
ncbi:DUF3140 domain-containing protein [Mycobacterium sp. IDR2000157661]|uniref:DUF3140 domain-containing protein n=1 Tax=Mycobacterium sp. IDR2000157661 TaxID=2867005 RepID=UPI001EEA4F1B|nr:DUF3140 domain-containing protein [Mycobacterium sp. IDR2000157661]ULE33198.1 DUF3140 domain-containing protein [Mycobacterium sp. IDR2000157661]